MHVAAESSLGRLCLQVGPLLVKQAVAALITPAVVVFGTQTRYSILQWVGSACQNEFLTSQNLPIPSLEHDSRRLQSQQALSFIEALSEMSSFSPFWPSVYLIFVKFSCSHHCIKLNRPISIFISVSDPIPNRQKMYLGIFRLKALIKNSPFCIPDLLTG